MFSCKYATVPTHSLWLTWHLETTTGIPVHSQENAKILSQTLINILCTLLMNYILFFSFITALTLPLTSRTFHWEAKVGRKYHDWKNILFGVQWNSKGFLYNTFHGERLWLSCKQKTKCLWLQQVHLQSNFITYFGECLLLI